MLFRSEDDDVDIDDDEMPMNSFPPVEIEKDDGGGHDNGGGHATSSSSSSGSSSSDSSSSSGICLNTSLVCWVKCWCEIVSSKMPDWVCLQILILGAFQGLTLMQMMHSRAPLV